MLASRFPFALNLTKTTSAIPPDRLVHWYNNYDRYTSFDSAIMGQEATLNLAACKIKLGYLEEAASLLEPLRNDSKTGIAARQNLDLITELQTTNR